MSSELKSQYEAILQALQAKEYAAAKSQSQALLKSHSHWPLAHALWGLVHVQQGQSQEAEKGFLQALRLAPNNPDFWKNYLSLLSQEGRIPEGVNLCLQYVEQLGTEALSACLQWFQKHTEAAHAIPLYFRQEALQPQRTALIELAQRHSTAHAPILIRSFQLLPPQHPHRAEIVNAVSVLFLNQNNYSAAQQLLEQEVQKTPSALLWTNLGSAYKELGQSERAVQCFQQALELNPQFEMAHLLWAEQLLIRQNFEQAARHLEACAQLPQAQNYLAYWGNQFYRAEQWEKAHRYFKACESFVGQLEDQGSYYFARSRCAHQLMQYGEQKHFAQLAKKHAAPLKYDFASAILFPYIYQDGAELEQTRAQFQDILERFQSKVQRRIRNKKSVSHIEFMPPFFLAYQGQNDRLIMEQIAQIWRQILKARGEYREQSSPPPQQRERIRIGFVSKFFYRHSITICFGNTICELGQSETFETYAFSLDSGQPDEATRRIQEHVQHYIQGERLAIQDAILEAELDILVYTELGMDGDSYLLALNRLAPIQCVLPGHPCTSGIDSIDYYISNALAEPPDAQAHYTETLVRLKTGISVYDPLEAPPPTTRTALGLPEDKRIYFCPMKFYKIHPDFDRAVALILEKDPEAYVYFVHNPETLEREAFEGRFHKQWPQYAARVQFLEWMPRERLLQVIRHSDIALDSYYFGAGSTARMVLDCGTPLMALISPLFRGRIAYCCYRIMGISESDNPALAKSIEEYADNAVALASNPTRLQRFRQEILEKKDILFQRRSNTTEMMAFFEAALESYPQRIQWPRTETTQAED